MNTLDLCSPVVRSSNMEVSTYADLKGTSELTLTTFSENIKWVLEAGCYVIFMHGGKELRTGGGFCDVGRFGNSLYSGIEEAKILCKRYKIDKDSSLSVKVFAEFKMVPTLGPAEDQKRFFGRYAYKHLGRHWFFFLNDDKKERLGIDATHPKKTVCIWSSDKDMGDDKDLENEIKKEFSLESVLGTYFKEPSKYETDVKNYIELQENAPRELATNRSDY